MTNHTLQKKMIQSGATLCAVAVLMGAFGSHELKERIDENSLHTFETGVRYLFYHALAIIVLGNMLRRMEEKTARNVWYMMLAGMGVFSGSLILLSTRSLTLGDSIYWLGGITPVGGLLLAASWILLAYNGYKVADGADGKDYRKRHYRNKGEQTTEEKTAN